jgi:hypothetical protein
MLDKLLEDMVTKLIDLTKVGEGHIETRCARGRQKKNNR